MRAYIEKIRKGHDLTVEEMSLVVDAMMSGKAKSDDIAAILLGLREKGESCDELAGAATAMRQHMTPIRSSRVDLVDTCGTGGDGSRTFNISTAAAIVAAGAGLAVAKHGNRKITSKSGSADVLTELGVNINASVETVERCLEEVGICFCFAQALHPSMKNVAEVRQRLKVPTIFNLLGPLCNPAGADYQVLGVGRPESRALIAAALNRIGCRRAAVVHGNDGLCEVSNAAETSVSLVEGGRIEETTWSPEDFGIQRSTRKPLQVDHPKQSAELIREILAGAAGPPRDIVVMNAATALWVAGKVEDLQLAARMAEVSIDDGQAKALLEELAEVSHS